MSVLLSQVRNHANPVQHRALLGLQQQLDRQVVREGLPSESELASFNAKVDQMMEEAFDQLQQDGEPNPLLEQMEGLYRRFLERRLEKEMGGKGGAQVS